MHTPRKILPNLGMEVIN